VDAQCDKLETVMGQTKLTTLVIAEVQDKQRSQQRADAMPKTTLICPAISTELRLVTDRYRAIAITARDMTKPPKTCIRCNRILYFKSVGFRFGCRFVT